AGQVCQSGQAGGGTARADRRRDQGQVLGGVPSLLGQGPAGGQDRHDRQLYRTGAVRGRHLSGVGGGSGGLPRQDLRQKEDQGELLRRRKLRLHDQFQGGGLDGTRRALRAAHTSRVPCKSAGKTGDSRAFHV